MMVIADHAAHYHSIVGDSELVFTHGRGMHAGEHISTFSVASAVRPSAVRVRRYDYQRPGATTVADASITRPSGATLGPPSRRVDSGVGRLRVYDHQANYDEERLLPESAARMLEQVRRNAELGRGSSNCRRLTPGAWFKLHDSSSEAFEGQWAVTRVEHRGRSAAPGDERSHLEYENVFRCVAKSTHYAPKLPERRLQHGLETATVVGATEEEIHTDELGRVKVQFHWDIDGGLNDQSSAWLRVVQGWSGKHAGVQFIPRVGTEVVVGFLGGDTDRPVVMGSLYNGTHAPPFKLPAEKTRSGIRTSSTPGGVGHNELSFEDAAGREEVRIHAQRDLQEVVLHDRNMEVGADLNVVIAGNSMESVGGERVEVIRGGRASTVMGDASRHVVGAERAVVDGDRVEVVRGMADLIAQRMSTRVHESEERVVLGDARATVSGDQAERVDGCVTLQVGKDEAQTSYAMHVEGLAELHGRAGASLTSEEEITLTCGRSSIRLTPDQIELVAPLVLFTAEGAAAQLGKDKLRMRATSEATLMADTIVLRGERASVGLDVQARVGGDKIHLGKSDDAEDFSPDERPAPTRLELVDQEGQPLAYRRYKLYLADGSTRAGILDRNGVAEIDLEQAAEVVFDSVQDLHAR
ncbi:MAG: type VI secretion system tip protein TssI/VgrG [Polyangiaceae bacterium]